MEVGLVEVCHEVSLLPPGAKAKHNSLTVEAVRDNSQEAIVVQMRVRGVSSNVNIFGVVGESTQNCHDWFSRDIGGGLVVGVLVDPVEPACFLRVDKSEA